MMQCGDGRWKLVLCDMVWLTLLRVLLVLESISQLDAVQSAAALLVIADSRLVRALPFMRSAL
jgi:hypothetical protein